MADLEKKESKNESQGNAQGDQGPDVKLTKRERLDNELMDCTERALKSKGYLLFMAIITEEKDVNGNFKIQTRYIRAEFPAEDLLKEPNPENPNGGPIKQLEKFIINDLRGR